MRKRGLAMARYLYVRAVGVFCHTAEDNYGPTSISISDW